MSRSVRLASVTLPPGIPVKFLVMRMQLDVPLSGHLRVGGNTVARELVFTSPSMPSDVLAESIFAQVCKADKQSTTSRWTNPGSSSSPVDSEVAYVDWNLIVKTGRRHANRSTARHRNPKPPAGSTSQTGAPLSAARPETPDREKLQAAVNWKHRRSLEFLKSLVIIGANGKGKSTMAHAMQQQVSTGKP